MPLREEKECRKCQGVVIEESIKIGTVKRTTPSGKPLKSSRPVFAEIWKCQSCGWEPPMNW